MKPLTFLGILLCLAALLVWTTLPVPSGRVVKAASDDTPLADLMLEIQGTLKLIRRSVRKPEKNAESLQHCDQLVKATLACRLMTPPMSEKMPENQKAELVAAYRKMMVQMAQKILELETAVLDGDLENAQELYKVIADMEDSGHEKFTEGE